MTQISDISCLDTRCQKRDNKKSINRQDGNTLIKSISISTLSKQKTTSSKLFLWSLRGKLIDQYLDGQGRVSHTGSSQGFSPLNPLERFFLEAQMRPKRQETVPQQMSLLVLQNPAGSYYTFPVENCWSGTHVDGVFFLILFRLIHLGFYFYLYLFPSFLSVFIHQLCMSSILDASKA